MKNQTSSSWLKGILPDLISFSGATPIVPSLNVDKSPFGIYTTDTILSSSFRCNSFTFYEEYRRFHRITRLQDSDVYTENVFLSSLFFCSERLTIKSILLTSLHKSLGMKIAIDYFICIFHQCSFKNRGNYDEESLVYSIVHWIHNMRTHNFE